MSSAARQKFQTECGHTFTVAPVEAVGGKMEGKWQLRVSGPKVTGKSGVKCMYSDPDQASALKAAARFLRCHIFTITPAIGPDAAADKTREPLGPIERMPERQVARGRSRPDATKAPAKAATEEAHHAEGVGGDSSGGIYLHVEGEEQPRRVSVQTRSYGKGYSNKLAAEGVAAPPQAPNSEQAELLRLVVEKRENVFISGAAGTGKSFLLQHIQAGLADKVSPGSLHLTASTGIAAVNIGGSTIHSFSGIGLGAGKHDNIIAKVMKSRASLERWRTAEALIIDEVSMLSADTFELLDEVARAARGVPDEPFGGVQLILCGDFFQLGPVRHAGPREFAFESDAWASAIRHHAVLKEVMRQKGDPGLAAVLEEVRWGALSPQAVSSLLACDRPLPTGDGILPTRLHCRNVDVDKENTAALARLPGWMFTYEAMYSGDPKGPAATKLAKGCPAAERLQIKAGAQVVLLKNLEDGLVNGSRGIVLSVDRETGWPRVRFACGAVREIAPNRWSRACGPLDIASCTQIPLKLAWALTVHRAQGMTLDRAECVVGDAFTAGQVYVALSRVTAFAGLELHGFTPAKVRASPKVVAFYRDVCHCQPPAAAALAAASSPGNEAAGAARSGTVVDAKPWPPTSKRVTPPASPVDDVPLLARRKTMATRKV